MFFISKVDILLRHVSFFAHFGRALLMLFYCCVSFRFGNFNLFVLILQRGSIKNYFNYLFVLTSAIEC